MCGELLISQEGIHINQSAMTFLNSGSSASEIYLTCEPLEVNKVLKKLNWQFSSIIIQLHQKLLPIYLQVKLMTSIDLQSLHVDMQFHQGVTINPFSHILLLQSIVLTFAILMPVSHFFSVYSSLQQKYRRSLDFFCNFGCLRAKQCSVGALNFFRQPNPR